MVIVLEAHEALSPTGKPVAKPIPVAPVVACVIFGVSNSLKHIGGMVEAVPTVFSGLTVTVEVTVAVQPILSVTVTVNAPAVVTFMLLVVLDAVLFHK